MDMEQAEQLFINEAFELLEEMESCLLDIDSGEASVVDHIAAIFRAAHTIKGSAGLFGFDDIVAFTHKVESVLDDVRADKLTFTDDLSDLMFACHGHIQSLVTSINDADSKPSQTEGLELINRLNKYIAKENESADNEEPPQETSESINSDDYWVIEVEYGEDVFRDGMDPQSHINYLENTGKLHDCRMRTRFDLEKFDPESCYINIIMVYEGTLSKAEIEEVFEFVQENSVIKISTPSSYKERFQGQSDSDDPIGEILLKVGAITQRELKTALSIQNTPDATQQKPLGEHLVEGGVVDRGLVDAALETQTKQSHKKPQVLNFLKVDSRKLDRLISLIGEMVTSGSAIDLQVKRLNDDRLDEVFSTMFGLIEQIRDGALQLRMVQIGETFNRLKRIVRDVAKELDKDINLTISGAETELDKTMVEKLSDPLMHIVRNAIDHGIESKDDRTYKGKDKTGQVELNAYHESGSVVIEVVDDGAGLDANRIKQKAIEKNIIRPSDQLTNEQVYQLIFEAGFSTAEAVTNLSGRGVGMDVVKRNIEELKGQVSIESEEGKGSRFKIRLPLTLAIIDGFEVTVGDSHLVIPQNMIQECLTFEKEFLDIDRNYVNLRREVLPFIDLSDVLNIKSSSSGYRHLVVVKYADKKAGLVVDDLYGELQAVIKPLSEIFRSMRGIGGSTILGTGDVGFILDIPQLIQFACDQEEDRLSKVPSKMMRQGH